MTTEHILHRDLATSRPGLANRLTGIFATMASFWYAMRNRGEITSLNELDDNQLADIGLTRHDLNSALLTSTFFEDPSSHLTSVARRRSRISVLDALRG
jgi:uncharacterized protein YjiS (DUF1127 family)